MSPAPGEQERVEAVDRLVASGEPGLAPLLAMLTDRSWQVRRAVVAGLASLGDLATAPLGALLVGQRDSEARLAAAVDALVHSSGRVEPVLIPLLRDENPAVAADAAQVLGRRRSQEALPALIEQLAHPDQNVALAATEALGRVGGRAAIEALVRAVESGSFFQVFPAIPVLGRSGDPRAVGPLATLLGQPLYAAEAARALALTGEPAAVPPLVAWAASGAPEVAQAAAAALLELERSRRERFGEARSVRAALERAATPATVDALGAALQATSPSGTAARSTADQSTTLCTVLGWTRSARAIPLLEPLLARPETAAAAAEALQHSGDGWEGALSRALDGGDSATRASLLPSIRTSAMGEPVAACLADSDPGVRALACATLARIGAVRAVPVLFQLLGDADPRVVQAATAAVQSLGGSQTERLAAQACASPSPTERRAALWILGHFGSAESFPHFERALADPEERVRDAAIQGLPLLEHPRALPTLLARAREGDARQRAQAARALGQCPGDPRVTAQLLRGIADPDGWVRYYAAQALGRLGLTAAAAPLAALVVDPAPQVRVAALEALSHLPDPRAEAALAAAARSDELDLRRAALIGLGLQRRPETLPLLLEAAGGDDPPTRLIALSALAELPGAGAVAALATAARGPESAESVAAIGFLGASRATAAATRVLIGLLQDEGRREPALAALAVPAPGRIAALGAALEEASEEAAPWLVAALLRLHEAAPPGSEDPDAERADAALTGAMTSANPAARKAAAVALGSLGAPALLQLVRRAAQADPDPGVRRVCELVLAS